MLCAVLAPLAGVRAQTPEAAPPAPAAAAAPAPPSQSAQPAQPGGPDLGFDLFDDAPKKSAAQLQIDLKAAQDAERKGRLRRQLLTAHQAFGFSTLAVFAATLVIGQLNYQDKYVSGDFSGRYEQAHLGLGVATSGLFATTGALALFAPNPYPKKYRLDSAMIHRVAMGLAAAGMVAQVVLGPIIDTHAGRLDQPRLALGHLIAGYATFAFMATGTIAYVF
ncbi:MAG: hypothetical protein U1A78_34060 [Polyangia bacterium]